MKDEEKALFEQRKDTIEALMRDKTYVPMKIKELAIILQVQREERDALTQVLDALIADGRIEVTKRGKYQIAQEQLLTGTFVGNAKGFGFVEIDEQKEDLYIAPENTLGAFHGDTVQAAVLRKKGGRRPEGKIVRILAHEVKELIGTYQKSRNYGFVVSDNRKFCRDIFIPQGAGAGAVDGHKVIAEITDYGEKKRNPEGRIKEIVGHADDPGTDILSVVYACGIPREFSDRAMQQAERTAVEVSPADRVGRLDLRDLQMVTIDGEDAKDLDDAVSLTKGEGLWHLGVHIADVCNYVQEGSALDREAVKRGTSVYLTDRVIPMLPHKLSNGICSLNAGEDRLALSCLMDIDEKGNVVSHRIAETVIRVDRRMNYTDVNKILTDPACPEAERDADFVPMLTDMAGLSETLRRRRHARGAIDFDFPEAKILLDADGKPVDIVARERNRATKLIEDFMLAANETVAEDFFWQDLPFVYRTHENPDPEKIRALQEFLRGFGYSVRGSKDGIHPKELQKLMERIEDTPEETMISRMTLRSMRQARYSTRCTGHFGLAAKYYCHFTSPIRRYPDLQIHRIIKDTLRGRMTPERITHYTEILDAVAEQASQTERRAEEAERDADKMKKAEYMTRRVGKTYDGIISGMNAWGVYVELENTVEGLVHISNMPDDWYVYDEKRLEMIGEEHGRVLRLGQRVKVRVLGADKSSRTVDFAFEE